MGGYQNTGYKCQLAAGATECLAVLGNLVEKDVRKRRQYWQLFCKCEIRFMYLADVGKEMLLLGYSERKDLKVIAVLQNMVKVRGLIRLPGEHGDIGNDGAIY